MHFTPAVRCRTLLLAIFTVLAAAARVEAQCALQWQSTGGYPGADGVVSVAVEWDPDGAGPAPEVAVVGGEFTAVGDVVANHVGAFNVATNSWSALGNGTNGPVRALLGLPNGELIVAGAFTSASGVAAANVARWDGVAFHALGAGVDGEVHALARLPNGDLVVGGQFQFAGGAAAANLARWDGVAWSAFGSGANAAVLALAATPTGELFAGGEFTTIDGVAAAHLARFAAAWSVVGGGCDGAVESMALLASGELVVAGAFQHAGPVPASVARWNGVAWSAMAGGLNSVERGHAVRVLPSGELVLGTLASFGDAHALRWSGSIWVPLTSILFGADSAPRVDAVARLANGDLLIAGDFTMPTIRIAHVVAGTSILGFASGLASACTSLCEVPNGGVFASTLHRLETLANGAWMPALDEFYQSTVFSPPPRDRIVALDDGRIFVAGIFHFTWSDWNGVTWHSYAQAAIYDPGGSPSYWSVWPAWGNAEASGFAVSKPSNGHFLFAGSGLFGANSWYVGSFWTSGVSWVGYGLGYGTVAGLAAFANGDAALGVTDGGSEVRRSTGSSSSWTTLGALNAPARTLLVTSADDLIAGGDFTTINGLAANHIARWSGSSWSTLGSGAGSGINGPVHALLELPNGDLIAGGAFTMAGGVPAANLARWNGTAWSALATTMNGAVDALMLAHDGTLWVGGAFTIIDNIASSYVARLLPTCPATATSLGAGCTGTGGLNTLTATSLPWQDSTFRSQATGLAPNSIALIVNGLSTLSIPLPLILPIGVPGCDLLASPDVLDLALPNAGVAAIALALPSSSVLVGQSIWQQVLGVELDALGLSALTSTNALLLTVGAL